MPRAAHRVLDDQPLAELPAVMRAGRADREDLPAAASQQHCVVANLTDKRRTIGELAFGNTVRQVRFVLTCVRHLILPQNVWLLQLSADAPVSSSFNTTASLCASSRAA